MVKVNIKEYRDTMYIEKCNVIITYEKITVIAYKNVAKYNRLKLLTKKINSYYL